MFLWYKKDTVCYVFLADVSKTSNIPGASSRLCESLWFTRGWTLQELIAPARLCFYSAHWHMLGTKAELAKKLCSITGIETEFLTGNDLSRASAAKKMSWAASRRTTRVEDAAYSLLGIFDINMPLLYGEGRKAFQRLQQEIIKANPADHSIFAWGDLCNTPSSNIPFPSPRRGSCHPAHLSRRS